MIASLKPWEHEESAPVSVKRRKRNMLRRHWLSGALICGLLGVAGYTCTLLYQADLRHKQVQATRAELEAELQEARRHNQNLQAEMARVSDDQYMEMLAKGIGFVYPHETVHQKGSTKRQ